MSDLPSIKDLTQLIKSIKAQISDEYRAFEGDDEPGIQLTVAWNPASAEWNYQTGDNCFMGAAYHYPIWAVCGVYRRSNCRDLAHELQSGLSEQNFS